MDNKHLSTYFDEHLRCPLIIKDEEALRLLAPYVRKVVVTDIEIPEYPCGDPEKSMSWVKRAVDPSEYWYRNDGVPITKSDWGWNEEHTNTVNRNPTSTDHQWEQEWQMDNNGDLLVISYWYRGGQGCSCFGGERDITDDEFFEETFSRCSTYSSEGEEEFRPFNEKERAEYRSHTKIYRNDDGKVIGSHHEDFPAARQYMGYATFDPETLILKKGISISWF